MDVATAVYKVQSLRDLSANIACRVRAAPPQAFLIHSVDIRAAQR
jgi:hypothetical protein